MLKEFLCRFPCEQKNVKSRSKIAPFFKWASFWNLIFKKENNYIFQKKIILTTQRSRNFACDNYFFPKTRANKNKQWTHLGAFNLLCKVERYLPDTSVKIWTWQESDSTVYRCHCCLRGYCTPGPYFWKLCAFSQKIKQLRTKYSMDLDRNVPRNSKITVLLQLRPLLWSYSEKCAKIHIFHVLSHKSITTWVSEIPMQ